MHVSKKVSDAKQIYPWDTNHRIGIRSSRTVDHVSNRESWRDSCLCMSIRCCSWRWCNPPSYGPWSTSRVGLEGSDPSSRTASIVESLASRCIHRRPFPILHASCLCLDTICKLITVAAPCHQVLSRQGTDHAYRPRLKRGNYDQLAPRDLKRRIRVGKALTVQKLIKVCIRDLLDWFDIINRDQFVIGFENPDLDEVYRALGLNQHGYIRHSRWRSLLSKNSNPASLKARWVRSNLLIRERVSCGLS